MDNTKTKFKDQPYYKYWGDWKFINPYWVVFLAVIYEVNLLVINGFAGNTGIRITNDILIKRTILGVNDIPEVPVIGIIFAIISLVLIVGILYISVSVLPSGNEHNRLRLAGIFVMEGLAFKAISAVIIHDMSFHIEIGESLKLPMITLVDLYLVGGLIATIVIFAKNYSEQVIAEIVGDWKAKRQKKKVK